MLTSLSPFSFRIDGVNVRDVPLGSEDRKSRRLPPGEHWYPSTPSLIQMSLWDSSTPWAGIAPWNATSQFSARFEWLAIQCYDAQDLPVARFGLEDVAPVVTTTTARPTTTARNTVKTPTPSPSPLGASGTSGVVGGLQGGVVGVLVAAVVAAMVALVEHA